MYLKQNLELNSSVLISNFSQKLGFTYCYSTKLLLSRLSIEVTVVAEQMTDNLTRTPTKIGNLPSTSSLSAVWCTLSNSISRLIIVIGMSVKVKEL